MKLKRILFLIAGCISLGIGCVGIVLPILPTVPFFLITVFCFANSSQKLHDWFVSTSMYKKHLESFVKKKGMTIKTKATIMTSVTLFMGLGFCMMFRVPTGQIILGIVWVCHMVYFLFGVKTIRKGDLEKLYPYTVYLQPENTGDKKSARKLVRTLNKNTCIKASLDASACSVIVRFQQEPDKDKLLQEAQKAGFTANFPQVLQTKKNSHT